MKTPEWHDYSKEIPRQAGEKQYIVQYRKSSGLREYAIDKWAGNTWWRVNNVIKWAEIPAPD